MTGFPTRLLAGLVLLASTAGCEHITHKPQPRRPVSGARSEAPPPPAPLLAGAADAMGPALALSLGRAMARL